MYVYITVGWILSVLVMFMIDKKEVVMPSPSMILMLMAAWPIFVVAAVVQELGE